MPRSGLLRRIGLAAYLALMGLAFLALALSIALAVARDPVLDAVCAVLALRC